MPAFAICLTRHASGCDNTLTQVGHWWEAVENIIASFMGYGMRDEKEE